MAGPPAWLIGTVTGMVALMLLGFDFALFASGGGIAFAAIAAFWIGAGAAAVIDPSHAGRNAGIVATTILAIMILFVAVISSRAAPPGASSGGPNVLPPNLQSVPP